MTDDEKILDLLAIFHYIVGGLTALFACFPLVHVGLGLAMILGKMEEANPPPAWIGWLFVILGGFFILCGWALAVAIFVAGTKLKKRTARIYCMVTGALECVMMPFGTILGVFTIITLMKDSVGKMFAANEPFKAASEPGGPSPRS